MYLTLTSNKYPENIPFLFPDSMCPLSTLIIDKCDSVD